MHVSMHEHAVIAQMVEMTKRWYDYSAENEPRTQKSLAEERHVIRRIPAFFSQLVSRHLVGLQSLLGPTGLIFYKNYPREINPEDFGLTDMEAARNIGRAETIQDIKYSIPTGRGLEHPFDKPEDLNLFQKMTVTACSHEGESLDALRTRVDSQILRTLTYVAKDGTWDAAKKFKNAVVYAHPSKQGIAELHGFAPIYTEECPEEHILIGERKDHYHAPLYFSPYMMCKTKDQYKFRYGITCPTNYPHQLKVADSSDLVMRITPSTE